MKWLTNYDSIHDETDHDETDLDAIKASINVLEVICRKQVRQLGELMQEEM